MPSCFCAFALCSRQGDGLAKDTPTPQTRDVVPGSEAPECLTPKDGGVLRMIGRSSSSSDTQSDGEWDQLAIDLVRGETSTSRGLYPRFVTERFCFGRAGRSGSDGRHVDVLV